MSASNDDSRIHLSDESRKIGVGSAKSRSDVEQESAGVALERIGTTSLVASLAGLLAGIAATGTSAVVLGAVIGGVVAAIVDRSLRPDKKEDNRQEH